MVYLLPQHLWNVLSISYDITALLISASFGCLFAIQFCKYSQKEKWWLRVGCISFTFSYAFRYLQSSIFFIVYGDWTSYSPTLLRIDKIVGDTGFIVAHAAFYFILLYRLYNVFKDTTLRLHPLELMLFVVAEIGIVVINTMHFALQNGHELIARVLLFPFILLSVLTGIVLIWAFNKRLLTLVVSQQNWFRRNSSPSLVSSV